MAFDKNKQKGYRGEKLHLLQPSHHLHLLLAFSTPEHAKQKLKLVVDQIHLS